MKNIANNVISKRTTAGLYPKNELAIRFTHIRAQTLHLVRNLSAEDCQIQSMPDASPTKWHLAHTTWFFETFILEQFEKPFVPYDERFRVLFNSYYNGIGAKHPRAERGLISRPSLPEVMAYRAAVEERMLALLDQADTLGSANGHGGAPGALQAMVVMGLHHEQQHQELLLTDIKHVLSRNPALPAYAKRWPLAPVQPQRLQWHSYAGGLQQIGYDAALDGAFSFDNESPRHRVWLEPFALASRLVTYGEYIEFIEDAGYTRPELWLSLGWDWVQAANRQLPLYWQLAGGVYSNFTLQGPVAIDPHTPVCHLSYFEADAFARWAGARLPTEHEWEHAARQQQAAGQAIEGNFVERNAFHPLPQREAPTP